MIDRTEMKYLVTFYIGWLLLLLEHICFKLEFSLELAIGWGIVSLLYTIPLLLRCAIRISTK